MVEHFAGQRFEAQHPEAQWMVVERDGSSLLQTNESDNANSPVAGLALIPLWNGLRRHALRILGVACVAALVAFLVCKRLKPMYESTATLEINSERTSDLLGPDAARTTWSDADQYIATQLRVIQEDSVLRPVVETLNLPLSDSAHSPDAPVALKELKVLRPPNTYLIQVSYRAHEPQLAADAANGIANSYLQHVFHSRLDDRKGQTSFMENQLDEVRAAMEKSSKAVNEFETRLGVVDPQDKTNILSARLLQLSTEYTSAQADRIKKEADFIGLKDGSLSAAQESDQAQNLNQLQTTLEQAQQKFVEVREHFGPKHPEYEKQAAIVAGLQHQIDGAKKTVTERSQVAFADARHREDILRGQLAEEKASFDKLNSTSYQYQELKVEAEGNRKLYDDLERRIKESAINGSFQNSTIQITDLARPAAKAAFPRTNLTVALVFALTLLIGMALAVGSELSDDTIRSATQIESDFRVPVLGAVPVCNLAEPSEPTLIEASGQEKSRQAFAAPVSIFSKKRQLHQRRLYDEAVRMLWSGFQLAGSESAGGARGVRSLLVTSAMPGEGKTTLTAKLATIHAMHNRRALLIDADLRRPTAHRHTHVPLCPGLAEVSRGEHTWRDAVVQSGLNPMLDVLPAGAASARSYDDIAHLLPRILAEAGADYDLVLVDGPPLLSFADPMHMASAVDGVLVVVSADKTTRRAVASMLLTLKRVRANLIGIALNRVATPSEAATYGYKYANDDANAA